MFKLSSVTVLAGWSVLQCINCEYISIVRSVNIPSFQRLNNAEKLFLKILEGCENSSLFLRVVRSSEKCPADDVKFYLKWRSFPVINPKNDSTLYPPEVIGINENTVQINLKPGGNVVQYNFRPSSGDYFGMVMLMNKRNVIKKITSIKCTYTLYLMLNIHLIPSINQIGTNTKQSITLAPKTDTIFYKFHTDIAIVQYTISLWNCKVNGTLVKNCPIIISAAANRIPSRLEENKVCCLYRVVFLNEEDCFEPLPKPSPSSNFPIDVRLNATTSEDALVSNEALSTSNRSIINYCPKFGRSWKKRNHFYITDGPILTFLLSVKRYLQDGGYLYFRTKLIETKLINGTESVNVILCVQPNEMPIKNKEINCKKYSYNVNETEIFQVLPYPQYGIWYFSISIQCFDSNGYRGECNGSYAVLELSKKAEYKECYQNCNNHGKCLNFINDIQQTTQCQCDSGRFGYVCQNGLKTKDSVQILYTLLLVLTNLFFIPSIILALKFRLFPAAIIYFLNMFFSAFYHACDMDHWSKYKFCLMQYSVLSFGDFYCSIWSFWITLMSVSELKNSIILPINSAAAILLAVGVQWNMHGFLTYIIPISLGGIIVLLAWIIAGYRQKKCYPGCKRGLFMLPGIILAGVGLCVYAFVETDDNYPFTHSSWHVCMALSIIFLLPRRPRENTNRQIDCLDLFKFPNKSHNYTFPQMDNLSNDVPLVVDT
ncbi:DgyrCDS9405 [Dimorphilus gyrociliatus]|uniref:DgyrCDS9405 n=1 Tax=Dimorphilus gyrociliatus TaxID=2664684 RepID=A0A7I8W261_9ANNE|nr:DgyrCDS9405 [Dimorphilus gyrociliatus]